MGVSEVIFYSLPAPWDWGAGAGVPKWSRPFPSGHILAIDWPGRAAVALILAKTAAQNSFPGGDPGVSAAPCPSKEGEGS